VHEPKHETIERVTNQDRWVLVNEVAALLQELPGGAGVGSGQKPMP
jgi:hypothetical protein